MATQASIEAAVAAYQSKLTVVSVRAVSISVGTMFGASLVTVLAFNFLRPSNKHVYATRLRYSATEQEKEKGVKWDPELEDKKWFAWMTPLISTKEPELFRELGLDAVCFLRFMKMLCYLFSAIAVLTVAILIPVNVSFNYANVPEDKRNALSTLTIADVKGNILFVHLSISYLINVLTMYLIWHNYQQMIRLRWKWFRSPSYQAHIFSRTLSVIRLPESTRSDPHLSEMFTSLSLPFPATSINVGHDAGDLPDLIAVHNEHVEALEKILARYLAGGEIGAKRPMMRLDGWMGLPIGGRKVDAIEWLTEEIEKAATRIKERRANLDKEAPTNYGFVSMASVPYAHSNMQVIRSQQRKMQDVLKGSKFASAPDTKDIIWENLGLPERVQDTKSLAGGLLLFVVFLWWTLPVLVISFLANLANIAAFVPVLQAWQRNSVGTFSAVSGILPPVVAGLFAFVLPIIVRGITKLQGTSTKTQLQRIVCGRYFDFLLISQLIVFTLISVLFNLCVGVIVALGEGKSLKTIFANFDSLPSSAASTYLITSSYWITWLPSRGFSAVFDLAQLINLVLVHIKNLFAGRRRTPREVREWTGPKVFKYDTYAANLLFMSAVGMAYQCLAPVVAGVCAVILWLWFYIYKYQLMFVYSAEVESGGRLWPILVDRLLVSLAFSNLLLSLTVSLAREWLYFLSFLPPTIAIIAFKIYCTQRFDLKFHYYLPDDDKERAAIHTHQADYRKARLQKRFEHPALHEELYTPMVDAAVAHLLPLMFKGKINDATPINEEASDAVIVGGGLRIDTVDETQLDFQMVDSGTDTDGSDDDLEEIIREPAKRTKELLGKLDKQVDKLLSVPILTRGARAGKSESATGSSATVSEAGAGGSVEK